MKNSIFPDVSDDESVDSFLEEIYDANESVRNAILDDLFIENNELAEKVRDLEREVSELRARFEEEVSTFKP